jgi:hypothetical protein
MSDPEVPEQIDITLRPHSEEEFLTVYCDAFDEPVTHSIEEVIDHLASLDVDDFTNSRDFRVDDTLY